MNEQAFEIDTALIETFVEDLRVRVVSVPERLQIASYLEALVAEHIRMRDRLSVDGSTAPDLLRELLAARQELQAYALATHGEDYCNPSLDAAIAKATGAA